MKNFIFTILGIYRRRAARAENEATDKKLGEALLDPDFLARVERRSTK